MSVNTTISLTVQCCKCISLLFCRHKQHGVTAQSRRNMYLLTKALAFLPERELCRGIADCLEVPNATIKDLACQLKKFSDSLPLRTGRRQPIILIPDEVLPLSMETIFHLTFRRRIKSHLPFAGVISSPYSPRFQDKG